VPGLAPELLVVAPLALAAGADLYLTLLFIGAAPTIGWSQPLPGALGDLETPGVLMAVGAFFVAEFAAERFRTTALVWNAFHAVIRPVSGALLGLLVLDGQPLGVVAAGSALSGALASWAHGIRSGASVLHRLSGAATPPVVLLSLGEDALVLGLVALALDAPAAAFGVALLCVAASVPVAPSLLRAFIYVIRLGIIRIFMDLGQKRWQRPEEIPEWVRRGASGAEPDSRGPGAGAEPLRGTPAAAYHLPGAPRFAVGWLVVFGDGPWFVFRTRGLRARVDLGELVVASIDDRDLFHRVDFDRGPASAFMLLDRGGPSVESLRAELAAPGGGVRDEAPGAKKNL